MSRIRSQVSAGKKDESDKPLGWPTHGNAKEARDRSAELAQETLGELRQILSHSNDAQILRWVAFAMDQQQTILRLLEEQGAPTRPI
jgi:hypothetical protein